MVTSRHMRGPVRLLVRRTLGGGGVVASGVVALVALALAPLPAEQTAGPVAPAPQASEPAAAGSSSLAVPMSVVWAFSMEPEPRNLLAPVVQNDLVYISHDGKLRCLELATGAKRWEFEPKGEEEGEHPGVCTAPVLWGDLVIVGADDSQLYALNAADGKEAWKAKCAGPVVPTPLVFGDMLILAAREMVYAVDPATGNPRWESSLASAAGWGPISDGAGLYFLCEDGSVQAVDPSTGRFRWSSEVLYGPLAFPPVMADRRVVVATGGRLVAVARTGAISWTADLPSGVGATPTVVGDTLYVPCVDGEVKALFARSGREQRAAVTRLPSAATTPPLVSDGMMLVGTAGALLCAADVGTGEVKWVYRCRAPDQAPSEAAEFGIYAPIVEAEGRVFCLTGAGDLYCFSPSAPDPIPPTFSDLKPEAASALPGGEAVTLSFAVVDDGSGVDASSLRLSVDGNPVRTVFDPADGTAEITFPSLPDGSHVVQVAARDFRGNERSLEWSFLTDKSIAPEPETQRPGVTQPSRLRGTTTGRAGTTR